MGPQEKWRTVMNTRGANEEETATLLTGYDAIFPDPVPRAQQGIDGDMVTKGGAATVASTKPLMNTYRETSYEKNQKVDMFATMPGGRRPSTGAGSALVRNIAAGAGCCILLLFLIASGFLIYLLWFQPSFSLYSKIMDGLGYLSPWTLLLILAIIVLVLLCCLPCILYPSFSKNPKPNDPLQIGGTAGLCCAATVLLVLIILGFVMWHNGESGSYRASNEICREYYKLNSPTQQICASKAAGQIAPAGATVVTVAPGAVVTVAPGAQAATTLAPLVGAITTAAAPTVVWKTTTAAPLTSAGATTVAAVTTAAATTAAATTAATTTAGLVPNIRRLREDSVIIPPRSVLLEAGADIDLDSVPGESLSSRQGTFSSWLPNQRRLDAAHDAALKFLHGLGTGSKRHPAKSLSRRLDAAHDSAVKFQNGLKASSNCTDAANLCKNVVAGWSDTTGCTCNGQAIGNATSLLGGYCDAWTPGGGSWCYTFQTTSCAGAPAPSQAAVSQGNNPLYSSGGPCGTSVASKYQPIIDGRWQFLMGLIVASIFTLLACCTLCCAANMLYNSSKEADGANGKKKNAAGAAGGQATAGGPFKSRNLVDAGASSVVPLEEQFRWAQEEASRKLSDDTSDFKRYELYGYFHQAVQGDCQGPRPSLLHHEDQRKYDAWNRLKRMARDEAMRRYIDCVRILPTNKDYREPEYN